MCGKWCIPSPARGRGFCWRARPTARGALREPTPGGPGLPCRGALGTSIVRVLHMTAGFTPRAEQRPGGQRGSGSSPNLTRDHSHASYYLCAKPVLIKIIAETGTAAWAPRCWARKAWTNAWGRIGHRHRRHKMSALISETSSTWPHHRVRPTIRSMSPGLWRATSRAAISRPWRRKRGGPTANCSSTCATRMNCGNSGS